MGMLIHPLQHLAFIEILFSLFVQEHFCKLHFNHHGEQLEIANMEKVQLSGKQLNVCSNFITNCNFFDMLIRSHFIIQSMALN